MSDARIKNVGGHTLDTERLYTLEEVERIALRAIREGRSGLLRAGYERVTAARIISFLPRLDDEGRLDGSHE